MANQRGPENQNKWPEYVKDQRRLSDSRIAVLTEGAKIPVKIKSDFKLKNRRRN